MLTLVKQEEMKNEMNKTFENEQNKKKRKKKGIWRWIKHIGNACWPNNVKQTKWRNT